MENRDIVHYILKTYPWTVYAHGNDTFFFNDITGKKIKNPDDYDIDYVNGLYQKIKSGKTFIFKYIEKLFGKKISNLCKFLYNTSSTFRKIIFEVMMSEDVSSEFAKIGGEK